MNQNKPKCEICKKETEAMYSINGRMFCDKHKEGAVIEEQGKQSLEVLRHRLQTWSPITGVKIRY